MSSLLCRYCSYWLEKGAQASICWRCWQLGREAA
jgi:hypothetical protein